MKLRLPHKFQAALMAALASVSFTTLSSGTAFAEENAAKSDGEMGLTLFMGDSITHGVLDAAYRWQLFKTFVDNGVYFSIDGPISGYYSTPADADNKGGSATYRGVGFVNEHYAKASGRSYEMINGTSRYNNITVDSLGNTYDIQTGSLLIGTNDLLSDKGYTYDNFKTKMQSLLGGTVTHSTTGTDAVWTWQKGSTMGNLGTIIDEMNLDAGDEFYVLSVPTWTTHDNNNEATIHAAVAGYNGLLQQWVSEYNATSAATVKYVDVNKGMVDLTSSTPFFANKAFFNNGSDGLHPSEQGSLIMAGNVARTMGIGGRTAGLTRSASTAEGWSHASDAITLHTGDQAQTLASGAFTATNGYTVDFTAVFGDGSENGWMDADKDRLAGKSVAKLSSFSTLSESLNITVGDGTHTGTLKLAEGYVAWSAGNGDMVLYCQNNSVSGNEALRIAYREADTANNILGGYYVWKGDMLIGQGLASVNGSLNGITLSITGTQNVGGTISNLSWANTAYAPTTELFSSTPLPSHDAAPVHLNIDFTDPTPATGQYGTTGQATTGTLVLLRQNETQDGGWFGPVGTAHSGDVSMKYSNVGTTNNANIISVINGGITNGGLSVVLDDGTHVGKGHYGSTGDQSFHGVYQQSVSGALQLEVNNATLDGGIIMGVINGSGSVGSTNLLVNAGAAIGGDIYGGNSTSGTITGNTAITITGGSVAGGVYGGNQNGGTIDGSTSVTITGGVISGNVAGGNQTSGTINGTTSVTIVGNLPYIGGNISADTVTLQNVAPDSDHSGTFDKYRGTITADKVVLNNYTVEQMLANIETKSLVLQGNSSTTIHNLTLTACDIHVDAGSSLILDGVNTYGNTATYNGHVAIADGTTFNLTNAEQVSGSETHYSDGEDGFVSGTFYVLKQATDEDTISGSDLYGTGGSPLSAANTETFIGAGILSGATFTYVAGDGTGGSLQATGGGTGGDYFVNTDNVVYSSTSEDYHAYSADSIRLNGGTLNVRENLKSGTTITVGAADSGLNLAAGTFVNATALTYDTGVSGFALSGEGELILTAANAEQMLTTVTGDGTMRLVETAVLNGEGASASAPKASLSSGTLIVGNGSGNTVQMKIGRTATGGSYVANYATIKSFQHVTLDKGELWFHTNSNNDALTVNGLTVTENGGSIHLQDVNAASTITLAGTTNLQGNLSYTNNWKDNTLDVNKLTGSGDFTVTVNNNSVALNLRDVSGWSGTMDLSTGGGKTHVIQGDSSLMSFRQGSGTGTYNFGTQNSTANFNGLTFEGTSAQVNIFTNSAAQNIHTNKLTLGSGMTLTAYYGQYVTAEGLTTKLVADTLQLLGDATIKTTQHGGYMEFGSITGSGTLTIQHTAGSTIRDTVSVGGNPDVDSATFTGKLLINEDNTGNGRGIFVVLNDKLTMSQAQLELKAQNTGGTRYVGVGINADLVQLGALIDGDNVGSLTAYTLFSGDASGSAAAQTYSGYGSRGGMRTLEITGAGGSTSIKVLNNISLAMSGSGTQSFTGDMSQFNGSINVTNGTLALTPNSAIATHEVEVETGGALTITTTGNNAITAYGTMVNDGTLNLNGTVALSSSDLSAFTVVEGTGEDQKYTRDGGVTYGTSGYLASSAQYYLVTGDGTVSGTYSIDANTGSLVSDKTTGGDVVVTFKTDPTGGMFYVNDNLTYASDMDAATGFVIAKDATLTSAGVAAAQSAKVLHGEGTYIAPTISNNWQTTETGYGLGKNITLGSDWTGTVVISGTSTSNMIDFARLANGKLSTVEVKGLTGWTNDWYGAIEENIKLTDVGSTVAWSNNASTQGSATAIFSGKWSGEGTFKRTGDKNINYTYTGDISEWTGKFDMNGGTTTLTFSGYTHEVNASIVKTGGTLNVTADTDVQFSKAITANTFTVNAGKTVTLAPAANDATYNVGSITNNGTIAVAAGKNASFLVSNNLDFGNVLVNDGGTLAVRGDGASRTFSFNELAVSGTGHLSNLGSGTKNVGFQSTINIANLTNTGESAVLTMGNAARASATVFNLNGGAFSGEIILRGEADNGTRLTGYQFNAAGVAADSIVTFDALSGKADNNSLGMGVGADITVQGIRHAEGSSVTSTIYSGNVNAGVSSFDSQGTDVHTITIAGAGSYATAATVKRHLNLVMNGQGTQTFSGDMSAFDGTITVNAGTLALTGTVGPSAGAVTVNGGTLTLANSGTDRGTLASVSVTGGTLNLDNMNVTGTTSVTGGMLNLTSSVQTFGLTVATGTTLKLAGENELTVNGLLTLQTGATLDLAKIFASPVQQPVMLAAPKANSLLSVGGNSGDSGLLSGGLLGAVEPADGATYVLATANEIDLASSGINLQNLADGYTGELSKRAATGGSGQELILTLAALSTELIWDGGTGTWDVGSTAHWHKSGAGTGTSTFTDGADVVFEAGDSTPTLATDIIASTMTLRDGAVVKVNMNNHTLTAELAGEGTYDLTGKSLGDVSLSEENWTGAVRLKDQELKSDNKDQKWLAALHNGKSWVEMNGFKGYDSSWASSAGSVWGNLTANIRLLDGEEKPAWEFDASASTLYTMYATGDWEGTGEFRFAGDKKQGVRFTGDISGWDGQLTSYASGERWVTFAGEAGDVKVQIARHGSGRLGLIVGDGSETFTATFQDTVSASSLEVKSNATAIISSTATLDSISGSGDISVTSTGTLDLTGACTFGGDLEVAGTLKLGTMGESAFTTTGTLTLDSGSTLNLSRLGITGGEFEPIVLAKGGTIDSTNLQNVTVDFGKQIDQEYTLSVDGSQNLVLTFNHPVEGLIWDNTKNNNHWSYDQETGKNWHAYGSGPGTSYFTEGADVIFASGVSGMQPQLQCDIVAGTITVESGVSVNLRTQGFTLKAENLIGAGGTKGGTVQKMGPGKMEIDNYVNLTALQVQNGTVVLNADADITTLSTTQGGVNRYITIAKDARVDVGTFNNAWGLNTLTVDGVMNVANTFQVSTSGMVNNITGSGTINAKEVNVSNQTTKAAFSGVTLNIGSGGITGNRPIEFGTMTVGVTDDAQGWSASRSVTLAANGVTTFAPDADKTITLSGVVDGSGALEKGGAGTLTLSGSNTYSGGTTVSAGILEAASASALGNGAVNVNGGTLSLTSSSPVTIGSGTIASGATLKLSKPGQFSVNSGEFSFTTGAILDLSALEITPGTPVTLGTATGEGSFSEDGLVGVTLDFGGQEISNAYLDVDTQNNLVLTFASPENLVWDNNTGNSSWDVNTSENWHQSDSSAGTSTFSTLDNVTFERSSSTVLQQDIATGNIQLQNAAALTIDTNGHDMTVSGAISGTNGSIVKNGDGMLVLKGTNTGDLTINDGTVLVGNAGALGTENNLDVVVNQGGTLSLAPGGSYEVDNLTLGLGSNLTFSGAVAEGQTPLLKIGTLNWTSSSSVDLSNVTLDSLGTYVLADVGTIVKSEDGLITDGLIQFVSMRGINGDALAADRMVSLHYDAVSKQLVLQLNEPTTGFYWKPDRENSVWDNLLKDGTGGTANWSKSSPYAEDEVVFVNQQDNVAAGKYANSAFFLDAGEDDEENITVNLTGYTTEGKPNTTGYVHDLVFAGEGDTYNLTSSDNHEIRLSTTVLSNFVVRKNTTVNFDGVDVSTGQMCVMHICEGAEYNSKNTTNWGTYSLNNEGVVNVDSQLVYMDAILAHVDNTGEMIVHYQDTEMGLLMTGQMINREEGTLVISAPVIYQAFGNTYGDGILHNEGKLVFDATDYKVTGKVETGLPIEGGGTFESVGPDTAVTLDGTLAQFSMKLGAHLTDFSAAVTIQDTTELTAENISASDGRATAHFSASSDLGDHVVMGADTTLDLDTASQAVYTMGEVHSATAGTDQNLIVRSGVTANVDGNVSLPDGKAQVAGGGKLTIGGAASTVGELAATDGGTAVVELNGATAGPDDDDLVLTVKKLSNENSTTLQVVNTDAKSAKTAQFNIGDATPEGGDYKGKLQYGVGANAAEGSGMNLTIKDDNVAAGAVLETSFSESAPAGSAANIVVDTAAAKVLGLTSDDNSANKTMVVSGATAGNSLEITGDGNYVYAGELGENLDITYSGDGKQTIEGGADDFSGKVTVDNGSSAAGVLAILNAASVDVTDVTLGTNDKLGVYKGSTATGEIANDGNVTMTGSHTLTAGKGAAMDAVLAMESGSTLDVSASAGTTGLLMGGSVTLNKGVTLSSSDMEKIMGMSFMDSYDLFSGVQAFSYNGTTPSSEAITFTSDWVKASDVFSNSEFTDKDYYVFYSGTAGGGKGGNVGAVYIMQIPEPATSTLSLLALAALAARRRRK